jgi:hypothetical protein
VAHRSDLVDELANELDTWPGVRIVVRGPDEALVLYEQHELGVLRRERGLAELRFAHVEHDHLVERGDAAPRDLAPESGWVTHSVDGPSDVTAGLELFDRRYRELRGDAEPFSSEDPTPSG